MEYQAGGAMEYQAGECGLNPSADTCFFHFFSKIYGAGRIACLSMHAVTDE